MRLLLLNNNPAVSRLIKLSVDKVGYEMDEFEEYALVPLKNYDLIMVDNESYNEEELQTLCEQSGCTYTLYICQRGAQKPEFTNVSLEKPFLPTDFLTLLERVKNVIESQKPLEPELAPYIQEDKAHSFDIDTIDTFGVENDSTEPIESLDAFESEEDEPLMDLASDEDEDDAFSMPTFDLDTKEEDGLDLTFIKGSEEQDEEEELSLGGFDFDALSPTEEAPLLDEMPLETAENTPCILDKDDINEVKQLLDESDEEDKRALLKSEEPMEEALHEEENFEEENFDEEALEEEVSPACLEEDSALMDEGFIPAEDNEDSLEEEATLALEDTLVETQEDLIDDFQEDIEEKIEDERMEPSVFVGLESPRLGSFDSLDDLNENAIKRAFGEDVEEDIFEEPAIEKTEQVEVIRGEIESSIARSISGLAQSDILKEALKGMRINISITFDEKN